jgi:hypothetical protein
MPEPIVQSGPASVGVTSAWANSGCFGHARPTPINIVFTPPAGGPHTLIDVTGDLIMNGADELQYAAMCWRELGPWIPPGHRTVLAGFPGPGLRPIKVLGTFTAPTPASGLVPSGCTFAVSYSDPSACMWGSFGGGFGGNSPGFAWLLYLHDTTVAALAAPTPWPFAPQPGVVVPADGKPRPIGSISFWTRPGGSDDDVHYASTIWGSSTVGPALGYGDGGDFQMSAPTPPCWSRVDDSLAGIHAFSTSDYELGGSSATVAVDLIPGHEYSICAVPWLEGIVSLFGRSVFGSTVDFSTLENYASPNPHWKYSGCGVEDWPTYAGVRPGGFGASVNPLTHFAFPNVTQGADIPTCFASAADPPDPPGGYSPPLSDTAYVGQNCYGPVPNVIGGSLTAEHYYHTGQRLHLEVRNVRVVGVALYTGSVSPPPPPQPSVTTRTSCAAPGPGGANPSSGQGENLLSLTPGYTVTTSAFHS